MERLGKASVLDKPNGKFVIRKYPIPKPKKETLLLRQVLCGVCGTDVHVYNGHLSGLSYPIILGHEIVGKVEELGEGVNVDTIGRPLSEKDLIILVPGLYCGKCYMCRILKEPGNCLNEAGYGFMGPADKEPYFLGGFGEYVYVAYPNSDFLKTNLPPKIAVLLEPLSIGINCAEKGGIKTGDIVVIQGSGAIGLFALVSAKESGASKVIVIGGPKKRLDLAKRLGANVTIDINEIRDPKERVSMVKSETSMGLGADVVIECTGIPATVPEGLEMVRPCGRFVEAGHYTDNGTCAINPHLHLLRKSMTITSVYGSELSHFVRGLSLLESRKYPFEEIISHILPLERVMDAIKAMLSGYKLDGEEVIKIAIAANP